MRIFQFVQIRTNLFKINLREFHKSETPFNKFLYLSPSRTWNSKFYTNKDLTRGHVQILGYNDKERLDFPERILLKLRIFSRIYSEPGVYNLKPETTFHLKIG